MYPTPGHLYAQAQLSGTTGSAIVLSMVLRLIQGLLLTLAVVSGIWQFMIPGGTPKPVSWVWLGFLIGLPILLVPLIHIHPRWTAMVVVMYATIGLALDIARDRRGEIVNCDSVQVYRGFDIGTAKVPAEVRREISHHLIDICDAGETFSAGDFAKQGRRALGDISSR